MTTTKVILFNWPKYLGALAIATAGVAAEAAGAPGWIRCLTQTGQVSITPFVKQFVFQR